jgi:hypothetical protein
MADMSKLKALSSGVRRTNLGAPPALDEASNNLAAPEIAPAPSTPAPLTPSVERRPMITEEISLPPRRDGRSMRRSGRTIQFATRVSSDFDTKLRDAAEAEGLLLVEILERALDLYISKKSSR